MAELPDETQATVRRTLDFARALAETRTADLRGADADIEPFAVVHDAEHGLRPVLLADVREHLNTPEGLNRVAGSLLARFGADCFAIVTRWFASPDGNPEHPQSREVVRVIVGHASGASGALYTDVTRTDEGPRLAGVWMPPDQLAEGAVPGL